MPHTVPKRPMNGAEAAGKRFREFVDANPDNVELKFSYAAFLRGEAFTEVDKVARAGRLASGSDQAAVAAQVACVLDHVHAIADQKHGDANQRKQRLLTVAALAAVLSALVGAAAVGRRARRDPGQ